MYSRKGFHVAARNLASSSRRLIIIALSATPLKLQASSFSKVIGGQVNALTTHFYKREVLPPS